jgi:hypothetical protein
LAHESHRCLHVPEKFVFLLIQRRIETFDSSIELGVETRRAVGVPRVMKGIYDACQMLSSNGNPQHA